MNCILESKLVTFLGLGSALRLGEGVRVERFGDLCDRERNSRHSSPKVNSSNPWMVSLSRMAESSTRPKRFSASRSKVK
jgi:hypothetical protein